MAFALYDRILIDVSNLYYRAYFVSKPAARTVDGKQMSTGGILMSLKMIERIEVNYLTDGGRLYFLFDNAFSGEERRRDIDPGYKANRNKRLPQFYRALDYLQLVLMHYKTGYRVVWKAETEADDLVEPILKSFEGRGLRVLLISNDMDWARGISNGTDWMVREGEQDVIYSGEAFLQKYGFTPTCGKICLYKALLGDESDNITPGVKGITRETVLDILQQAGSVRSLYMGLGGLNIPANTKESLRRARGKVEHNVRAKTGTLFFKNPWVFDAHLALPICRDIASISHEEGARFDIPEWVKSLDCSSANKDGFVKFRASINPTFVNLRWKGEYQKKAVLRGITQNRLALFLRLSAGDTRCASLAHYPPPPPWVR